MQPINFEKRQIMIYERIKPKKSKYYLIKRTFSIKFLYSFIHFIVLVQLLKNTTIITPWKSASVCKTSL